MWQKDTADVNGDGKYVGADTLPWCEALSYCENLSFAGHDDWRLPNVRELQSIVDYSGANPAIAPVFGAISGYYWSSTTFAGGAVRAWGVSFDVGVVSNVGKDDAGPYVRAVRGGR